MKDERSYFDLTEAGGKKPAGMNKDRLRAFRAAVREAQQLRDRLEEMEARIYGVSGQKLSSMPRSPSADGHTMDDLVGAHIALQDRYRVQLARIEREQLEIENAIQCLQPAGRMIIRYRYMDRLSWEEICARMSYGWTQVHRLHAEALRSLEEVDRKWRGTNL